MQVVFAILCLLSLLWVYVYNFSTGCGLEEAERALDSRIAQYRGATYAETTMSTYLSQIRCYIKFCIKYQYQPVPIIFMNLQRYIVYLAQFLNSNSIKQYLRRIATPPNCIRHSDNNVIKIVSQRFGTSVYTCK